MKEAFTALIVEDTPPAAEILDAFGRVLGSDDLDPAFKALTLRLPSDDDMAGSLADAGFTPDPAAIHKARHILRLSLAARHREALAGLFLSLAPAGPYEPDAKGAARRSLRTTALSLLSLVDGPDRADALFSKADNMTERLAALACLIEANAAEAALSDFYAKWHEKPGVLDKWFALQIVFAEPHEANRLATALTRHPDFDWQVPNRVRAVLGALARNHAGFHAEGGASYQSLASWIRRLDPLNPQIAASLTGAFQSWRRYDGDRQGQMQDALSHIAALDGLSRDTSEMVARLRHG
jgi:aminopeptidase N